MAGGACMAGGMHGQGGVHGRGHAWQGGACVAGTCMVGGVHGGGGVHGREGGMHGRGAYMTCMPPGRYYGYGIGSMSGRYASYWNAFLCRIF